MAKAARDPGPTPSTDHPPTSIPPLGLMYVARSSLYRGGGELFVDRGEVRLSDLEGAAAAGGWDAVVGWAVEGQSGEVMRIALLEGLLALAFLGFRAPFHELAAALRDGLHGLDELQVGGGPWACAAGIAADVLRGTAPGWVAAVEIVRGVARVLGPDAGDALPNLALAVIQRVALERFGAGELEGR